MRDYVLAVVALGLAAGAFAQTIGPVHPLPIAGTPLPPPPDETPRATVMLADYRYDDP